MEQIKKITVVDKAPETAKEGKMLQLKLGSKSRKTFVTKPSVGKPKAEKMSQKDFSSTIEKLETLDEDEATYGTMSHYKDSDEQETKLSWCRRVFGNFLCPACGITRWRKKPKILYSNPKAKDICSHILCRFNSIYYYFANMLGPEMKYYAEELFFKKGQIEADGLCAITAQIWAATYLLQFEVTTMKEVDWNEIRMCYLNLVWESQKLALENRKFYDLHQDFKKSIYEHLDKLDDIVGCKNTYDELDPPPDPKATRLIDGLFLHDDFRLKNRLVFLVSPPHEETVKFEDFSENYRIKTIKYFLKSSPMEAISLGQRTINNNYDLLQSGHLPLLTPNFPINSSKFTYCEGMDMLEEDLKDLFTNVCVPNGIRSDLIDWVTTIREITDQYASYGQWTADKINEMKEMCQLCYEYADKAYSMELPPMSSITQIVTQANNVSADLEEAIKPKLKECKIPITQRNALAEKYHSFHDKLENYKWLDFFRTEYHEVCTRLPLMHGPTEFIFHEAKHKKSRSKF